MVSRAVRKAIPGGGLQPQPVIPMMQDNGTPLTPNVFKPFSVTIASLGIGPQTIWDPGATERFRAMGFYVSSDKACVVNFRDGTVASFWNTPLLAAAGVFTPPAGFGEGYLSASKNNNLQIDVSAGVPVALNGMVWGRVDTQPD